MVSSLRTLALDRLCLNLPLSSLWNHISSVCILSSSTFLLVRASKPCNIIGQIRHFKILSLLSLTYRMEMQHWSIDLPTKSIWQICPCSIRIASEVYKSGIRTWHWQGTFYLNAKSPRMVTGRIYFILNISNTPKFIKFLLSKWSTEIIGHFNVQSTNSFRLT